MQYSYLEIGCTFLTRGMAASFSPKEWSAIPQSPGLRSPATDPHFSVTQLRKSAVTRLAPRLTAN